MQQIFNSLSVSKLKTNIELCFFAIMLLLISCKGQDEGQKKNGNQALIDEIYALEDIDRGWMVNKSSSNEGGVWTNNTATTEATGDAVFIQGFGNSAVDLEILENGSKDDYWFAAESAKGIAQVIDRGEGDKYIRIHNGPAMRWHSNVPSFSNPVDVIQVMRPYNGADFETDGFVKYTNIDTDWDPFLEGGSFIQANVSGGLYNFAIVRMTIDGSGNWEFRLNDLDKDTPDANGSGESFSFSQTFLGANGHPAAIHFYARYMNLGGTFSDASLNTIQNNWETMVGTAGSKPSFPCLSGFRFLDWDGSSESWSVPDGTFTGGSGIEGTHRYKWYYFNSADNTKFPIDNKLDNMKAIPVASASTQTLLRSEMQSEGSIYVGGSNPGSGHVYVVCIITPVDSEGLQGQQIVTRYSRDSN